VWRVFAPSARSDRPLAPVGATTASPPRAQPPPPRRTAASVAALAFAYGIRASHRHRDVPAGDRACPLPPGSPWLDLHWPIFGAGVIVGALLATRVRIGGDLRLVLAAAYVLQAIAIAIGIGAPTATGFALGSFLLGLPFTAITYFALQEVRRLRPGHVAGTTGLVTVLWSIGQAAGPPMVARLLRRGGAVDAAFTLALAIAAAAGPGRDRLPRFGAHLAPGADALIDSPPRRRRLPARTSERRPRPQSRPSDPYSDSANCQASSREANSWSPRLLAGRSPRVVAAAQEHARLPAGVAPSLDDRRRPVAVVRFRHCCLRRRASARIQVKPAPTRPAPSPR
jgi:hypothetical protein